MAEEKKTGHSRPSTSYAEYPTGRNASSRPPPPNPASPVPPAPPRATSPRPNTLRAPPLKETLRNPDPPTTVGRRFNETLQGMPPSDPPPRGLDEERTRLYSGPPPGLPMSLEDEDEPATSIVPPALASTPSVPAASGGSGTSGAAALRQPGPGRPEALKQTARYDAAPESVRVVDGAALADWQQVWLATQSRKWTSLAILPANRLQGDLLLKVANALRQIGVEHLKQPLTVLDHRGVTLRDVEKRMESVAATRAVGGKVLVVLDAIEKSTVSARYANVIDAAILVVILGESEIGAATKTVESFGKERFLGTLVIRPELVDARAGARTGEASETSGTKSDAAPPPKKRKFPTFRWGKS